MFISAAGCATRPAALPVHLLPVAESVYRGGQPRTDEQWDALAALGVRTVVKLNFETEGSDAGALARGMEVVRFEAPPSSVINWTGAMSMDQLRQAVEAMRRGHCYVHCTHGQDRTGLVVAAYRVWVDGWSKSDAMAEAKRLGYHPIFIGLDRLWEEVR
ncbi:MAG: phosphatase domain-containing protein [Verrucomicrobiota bacterium]